MKTNAWHRNIAQSYWVYILKCENGNYYTGYTTNLRRRYEEHLNGTAKCKYTRSFKPVSIAQSWKIKSKSIAMSMENLIKQMSKSEKEMIIRYPNKLSRLFNGE